VETDTKVLGVMVACLVSAGAGIAYHMLLALRQRTPNAIPADAYARRARIASLSTLGVVIVFFAIATTFNVWPGITHRVGSRHRKANGNAVKEIELPIATSTLITLSAAVGIAAGAMTSHYLRRLGADLRSAARGPRQMAHLALASLPFLAQFYAAFGFMFWLSRVSGSRLSALLDDPPRWFIVSFLAWLIAVFILGDLAARMIYLLGHRADKAN